MSKPIATSARGNACARARESEKRISSPRLFFCKAISGLSALSATVVSMVSSIGELSGPSNVTARKRSALKRPWFD